MKAKHVFILTIAGLLVVSCAIPVAWSTAPISPLPHTQEEGLSFHGGVRIGQPTQEDASARFMGGAHVGLLGQWSAFRMDLTAWGAGARYTFQKEFWNATTGQLDSITHVHVNATALHIQGNFAVAPRLDDNLRLESGVGLGLGYEANRKDKAYQLSRDTDIGSTVVVPTLTAFVGLSGNLDPHTALGFRWHFLGGGTGLTTSLRYRNLQVFVGTQPFTLLRTGSDPGYANWTAGIIGILPISKN
ncbi:MAG: hypothetical protein N2170_07885 [Bacteroidia bacterium]|nr:hypothetical protein [Bacteroidia bacterium]